MRIAFLFNHAVPHQVPHAAPFAFVLSRKYPQHEVIVACSTQQELDFATEIAALYPGQRCTLKLLPVPWPVRLMDPLVSLWSFRRKQAVLRRNLDFFKSLDALVSPEVHCVKLRRQRGLEKLCMIRVRHGAGDRDGVFDKRLLAFDYMLLPGQKYADRLRQQGLLRQKRYALSGYPKFEVVEALARPRRRLFAKDRPTVVYNPHFDAAQSSWQGMGLQVLDYFLEQEEYNLIFAPHVVLFKRRLRHAAFLPRKYRHAPHIHIDLGSSASLDMSYLQAADIYLGDVSSQVYEFLVRPRPSCIFLNSHLVDWQNNPSYVHWRCGQVVDSVVPGLQGALQQAEVLQAQFEPIQQNAFRYTFHREANTTAAAMGARAIADFLARENTKR